MNRLHEIDKKTYKQVAEVWRTAARPVFSGNINPLVNTLNLQQVDKLIEKKRYL